MVKETLLPDEIRRIRHILGETQAEFAKRLKVDPVSVARWETGQRRCTGLYASEIARLDPTNKRVEEFSVMTKASPAVSSSVHVPNHFEYDVFICHASEDKEQIARPLAEILSRLSFRVWYDEMTLKIGDSLRRKIDEGLSKSRYGVVILSPSFFSKEWTQYELDALVSREMADAVKVVLPVWHDVSAADVRKHSLPLSMRLAGRSSDGIDKLAHEIGEILGASPTINVPQASDELSQCKRVLLTEALADENRIFVNPANLRSGKSVVLNRYAFNDNEKQRQLFLHALEELQHAGLVEQLSECSYELTYLGIQAAERMERPLPVAARRLGMPTPLEKFRDMMTVEDESLFQKQALHVAKETARDAEFDKLIVTLREFAENYKIDTGKTEVLLLEIPHQGVFQFRVRGSLCNIRKGSGVNNVPVIKIDNGGAYNLSIEPEMRGTDFVGWQNFGSTDELAEKILLGTHNNSVFKSGKR